MTTKPILSFLATVAFLFIATPSFAQKAFESYNIERGMEAMSGGDYAEAAEYFLAELDENPDNGYAYTLLAVINYESGELGQALSAANAAIKNLPRRDKDNRALAHLYRAYVHEALEEYPDALSDYAAAIRLTPEESSCYYPEYSVAWDCHEHSDDSSNVPCHQEHYEYFKRICLDAA